MLKKFFTINIKNESIDFSSEFCLVDNIGNFLIAEDLSGNKIIFKISSIFLYIHDESEELEYTKIFNNLDEFYSNIDFYDEIEQDVRYKKLISEDNKEINQPDLEKKVLISTFVKKLGNKRLNLIYKEGSYYNVSKAFIDGNITKEEFEVFRFLPE